MALHTQQGAGSHMPGFMLVYGHLGSGMEGALGLGTMSGSSAGGSVHPGMPQLRPSSFGKPSWGSLGRGRKERKSPCAAQSQALYPGSAAAGAEQ